MTSVLDFNRGFEALTGNPPFPWQRRLFDTMSKGELPSSIDIPTGLGKTSVMAVWLLSRAVGAPVPRRLVYVVDRRAVVDQATELAIMMREKLNNCPQIKQLLDLNGRDLPISTLRGQHADNREWLQDPAAAAIIIGTVDMIGSRLLFSGYGVSRRMRPYTAGLLGCDSLVTLDEAHLAPSFAKLLLTVQQEKELAPCTVEDRNIIPPFKLLSLSATLGGAVDHRPFRLDSEDEKHEIVRMRLEARKALMIKNLEEKQKLENVLAEKAWDIATDSLQGNRTEGIPVRMLIYCNSRDVAEKVKRVLDSREKKAKCDTKSVLFTGGRRVHEREEAAEELKIYGLIAGTDALDACNSVIFLVATSAGEVGVDLDTDHMVCDLVPWERMVQRLGRVNRRGYGAARIVVIDQGVTNPKKAHEEAEKAVARHRDVRRLLEQLPSDGEAVYRAGPAALSNLARRETELVERATTPVPLYPALTRPLVDAWSMTSIAEHSGRPEVAPWLRGWIDEEPQTTVVWRKYLPLQYRSGVDGPDDPSYIEGFFDTVPIQITERLETETRRVTDWLQKRMEALSLSLQTGQTAAVDTETEGDPENLAQEADTLLNAINRTTPLVLLLDDNDKLRHFFCIEDINNGELQRKDLHRDLAGRTLVVDARVGGLRQGLLDSSDHQSPATIEDNWDKSQEGDTEQITKSTAMRIYPTREPPQTHAQAWEYLLSPEGEGLVWLVAANLDAATSNDNVPALARKEQYLDEHHEWAAAAARQIADALGLSEEDKAMLIAAASHHDDGKKAQRWQRAFNAPSDHIHSPYAKTRGPLKQQILNGYRHEFQSTIDAMDNGLADHSVTGPRFELALHLIAAHHGNARPNIDTRGCDSLPSSVATARAHDIALRFARLQRRWGPWGLAWWEALLRAADQQASRKLDAEPPDESLPKTTDQLRPEQDSIRLNARKVD